MKKPENEKKGIGRRAMLPALGGGLLLSLLPFRSKAAQAEAPDNAAEEYETLLKPDGTTVRVRKSSLKNAKTAAKPLSNAELLNWLGKDGKTK